MSERKPMRAWVPRTSLAPLGSGGGNAESDLVVELPIFVAAREREHDIRGEASSGDWKIGARQMRRTSESRDRVVDQRQVDHLCGRSGKNGTRARNGRRCFRERE